LDGIFVRLRLTAAVVVVFGATGGIGSALARRLHGLGSSGSGQAPSAIVISADGGDKLKSLQQQLQGVDAIPADALEPASVSILSLQVSLSAYTLSVTGDQCRNTLTCVMASALCMANLWFVRGNEAQNLH
jgi:NAD(P)-dependent dehydrogenase (short-subunit alcohol dehydrogenase family)